MQLFSKSKIDRNGKILFATIAVLGALSVFGTPKTVSALTIIGNTQSNQEQAQNGNWKRPAELFTVTATSTVENASFRVRTGETTIPGGSGNMVQYWTIQCANDAGTAWGWTYCHTFHDNYGGITGSSTQLTNTSFNDMAEMTTTVMDVDYSLTADQRTLYPGQKYVFTPPTVTYYWQQALFMAWKDSDVLANADIVWNDMSTQGISSFGSTGDLYFTINDNISSVTPMTINLISPTATSTALPSHIKFTINAGSTDKKGTKVIRWGHSTSSPSFAMDIFSDPFRTTQPANRTDTFWSPSPITEAGTWYVQIAFKDYSTVIATSSIVMFTTTTTDYIYNGPTPEEWDHTVQHLQPLPVEIFDRNATSTSLWYVDCSDATGWDVFTLSGMTCWAKKGFMEVGRFFLVPKYTDSLFESAFDYIKTGFPFSIGYGAMEIIINVMDGDTAYEALLLPVNLDGNHPSTTIELFDDTVPIQIMGQTWWDWLQTMIAGSLWVMLTFGMLVAIIAMF